jgi:23S rRNA pseudouridine2457 synthase
MPDSRHDGGDKEQAGYSFWILNKPYGVLCQFTGENDRPTLGAYGPFPKTVYPAGRLDADSEGLVFLTDDGALKHHLLDPAHRHPRTYWAQVERLPSEEALDRFRRGLVIEGKKTLPAEVRIFDIDPEVWERSAPIRFRKQVPTCWLEIIITEGRNRQVRKMTAAIGHPTLRLIRVALATFRLGDLMPGQRRKLSPGEITLLRKSLNKNNQN